MKLQPIGVMIVLKCYYSDVNLEPTVSYCFYFYFVISISYRTYLKHMHLYRNSMNIVWIFNTEYTANDKTFQHSDITDDGNIIIIIYDAL